MSIKGIPNGWRLVRVGRVHNGETRIDSNGNPLKWLDVEPSQSKNRVIIEPVKDSKQYREPELSDLANGPIEIEACTPDPHTGKGIWRKRKLVAIQTGGRKPFVVQHPNQPGLVVCYKEARIEVVTSSEASQSKIIPVNVEDIDAFIGLWPREIPPGFMLLSSSSKAEPREIGDCFWCVSRGRWEMIPDEILEKANQQSWTAIRRIPAEPIKIPDGWRELDESDHIEQSDKYDDGNRWMPYTYDPASPKSVRFNKSIHVRHIRKIKESPTDHIADASEMVPLAIPAGWRELNEGELLSIHDLFELNGEWTACKHDPLGDMYNSRIHKRHIRKIEQATQAEQVPDVKVTIYREPTQRDLANGPIRCRVRDSKEDRWLDRDLYAVMPETVIGRFVTISEDKRNVGSWVYCEIPSDHQAIRVGDLVRVTARQVGVYRVGWVNEMNRQVNKVAKVSGITHDGRFLLNGCGGWRFHRDWLELVETASEAKGSEA